MRKTTLAIVLAGLTACAGEDDETAPPVEPSDCEDGEWLRDDGLCIPAGLPPDMPCPPGEWSRDDGSCVPAGIPPDACGEGFEHDGDRGCEPILPASPCAPGFMAVPGETACHEVAPCAGGKWGDIPVETDTHYVDASYTGNDSDGSALKPWTAIQAAVDGATDGAIVAIAAGSYAEDVVVSDKAVRLWGVCPSLVEVVGSEAAIGAVTATNASGTEVRSLGLRGAANGFACSDALDVVLERVWVHDNARRGIVAENLLGPTSIEVRASLVEQNHGIGVFAQGVPATVHASVIRDTQPDAQGVGRGLEVDGDGTTPVEALVQQSVIERNHEIGVFVGAAYLTMEASVVRDTQPAGTGQFGHGFNALGHPATGMPATLVVRTSLVANNRELGLYIEGSAATVESTVIRETQLSGGGIGGRGVNLQANWNDGAPATLLLRTSLVERNHEVGVYVASSEATIESSVVRETQPEEDGMQGHGIGAQSQPLRAPPKLVVRYSLLEKNHEVGLLAFGADTVVEASLIRDTQLNVPGYGGRGLQLQVDPENGLPSTLVMERTAIEGSYEGAMFVAGSVATLHACHLRDTSPNTEELFGEGVVVLSLDAPARATITGTRVERSARAAVAAWGAELALADSVLACQLFDLVRESYEGVPATIVNQGGNLCGCPQPDGLCKAVSASLQPPPPIEPP